MKQKNILFLFVICSLLPVLCYTQWQPDFRLTNASENGYTSYGGRSIAVNGNIIHAAWRDHRHGNFEIYYKTSTDAGISWQPDTRLTNTSAISQDLSIAISGSSLHIVYSENYNQLRYLRSLDNGLTWTGYTLTSRSHQVYPTLAAAGPRLYIAWFESSSNSEIYYMYSTNGGTIWSGVATLTESTGLCAVPSIAVTGNDVHLTWVDTRNGGSEIFYKNSIGGPAFWGADTRLIYVSTQNHNPSIAAEGDIVHLVWGDNRNGNLEIYYTRSGNKGVYWSPEIRLTNAPGESNYPHLSFSYPYLHMVWHDNRSGNYEIYHKFSTDGSNWGTDTRLTVNTAISQMPSLGTSGSNLHVVWNDNRDGNMEIYYKRNPTGNPVGIEPVNSEIPDEFKLEQNYPNPFNPVTNIKFNITQASFVKLVVYDITGKEVTLLVNQQMNAGVYTVDFDASHLSSGIYLYRIETESFSDVKKMMLVK